MQDEPQTPEVEADDDAPVAEEPTADAAASNGHAPAPPPVWERLRQSQQEVRADRRETFPILPARFDGNLEVRVMPIDPAARRKAARRLRRANGGRWSSDTDLEMQAWVIAAATETILIRPEGGFDFAALKTGHEEDTEGFAPLHETYEPWVEGGPVRFDERLCQVLGVEGVEGNRPENVRLIFQNPEAMTELYTLVDFWLKETADFGDEEGEDDDEVRPT